MAQDNLLQYLPYALDNAFKKTLAPGEDVFVTLPGAMGEALVATSKRVVVLRDKGSSEGIDVISHQLKVMTGVKTGSSPAGGTLEIETPVPSEDDKRTVYYGSLDKTRFENAAQRINELVMAAHSETGGSVVVETTTASSNSNASVPALKCATCGVQVSDTDVFCSTCGTKLRDICQICSAPMDSGAAFCSHCGSEAKPAVMQCPACDAKANSTVMSYCPQCGTSLTAKCAACGAAVVPDWPRCRYCGREIGSEGIPGRGLRMQRERQEQYSSTASVEETAVGETEEEVESPAAKANAKGTEYFNDEKIDEAIEEFRRAVMLDPNNSSYHCNLAVAYGEADQEDDARREYERTLELNPKDITALLYLGYILNENDEAEEAAELWKRVIQLAPGTPEAEEAQQNLGAQDNL